MPVRLVSLTFTPRSREELTTALRDWIRASNALHHIVTLNPEMVMEATAHSAFASVVNRADAVTADGFGITLACRFLGAAVPDRVTGNDLVRLIGALSRDVPVRVYLLGGQRSVAH
ncbi:MAG: WecB/TagA/CpsF family glycosyltransferase, partial [Candidatus Kerfeldbacteria bacterium]|nr:WecB/TagA/CpsF family glycosyltransferase [Candidatus Kerfeldbacteria bacterium]